MSISGGARYHDHQMRRGWRDGWGLMVSEKLIEFASATVTLNPLPIRPQWILEGAPVAQFKILSASADGTAKTIIWDCTAGRFNWFYNMDETVYVLEGSVVIKDESGNSRRVVSGETILFRAGSQAEWSVENYIRKIAFLRTPVPNYALFAIRAMRVLKKLARIARGKEEPASMF
jgi:uncharacterized protein